MEAIFLRNFGWLSTDYTALYLRRQHCDVLCYWRRRSDWYKSSVQLLFTLLRIYTAYNQYTLIFPFCSKRLVFTWRLTTANCLGCRAEQSRAVTYCRQPASTVTRGIEPRWDPWPYICSVSRLLFFFSSFVVPPLIKRERLGFFYNWCYTLFHPRSH
jgi:hypothetical protein